MSKKVTLKRKSKEPKGKDVGDVGRNVAHIMSDLNIMEIEVKYSRTTGNAEVKVMLDVPEGCRVVYKVFKDDLLVHEHQEVVPHCPDTGTEPGWKVFDSIVMGEV